MNQFETEEQQVEAIKQFWKENGTAIVIGIVLGIGALWGWRYYSDSQIQAKEQASVAYQKSLEQFIERQDSSDINAFIEQYSDTAYADLAALISAQQAVTDEDFDNAISVLQSVASKTGAIADIANLRIASVYFQSAQIQPALDSLERIKSSAFNDQKFELKGDILYSDGQFDAAETAYNQALAELPGDANIQMKLDNIGYARASQQTQDVEELGSEGE